MVIVSGATVTVIDRSAEADTAEDPPGTGAPAGAPPAEAGGLSPSLTLPVKLAVPGAVGLPEMTPLAGSRLSLAGSAPCVTDQV